MTSPISQGLNETALEVGIDISARLLSRIGSTEDDKGTCLQLGDVGSFARAAQSEVSMPRSPAKNVADRFRLTVF